MKVTKYPQSCLLLEKDGGRILIDPGNFALDAYQLDDFGEIDAVFYTHRHADHFDTRLLDPLREREVTLVANPDVAGLLGEEKVTEVRGGDRVDVAGFEVAARELPHVPMVNGSPGPPNTGYVVDGAFFHPGDGMDITGLTVAAAGTPIAGPSISFRDAYRFVETLGARLAVPMHYDMFIADPELFARFCDVADVAVLDRGESVDVPA